MQKRWGDFQVSSQEEKIGSLAMTVLQGTQTANVQGCPLLYGQLIALNRRTAYSLHC
jgi:hypothetical protein